MLIRKSDGVHTRSSGDVRPGARSTRARASRTRSVLKTGSAVLIAAAMVSCTDERPESSAPVPGSPTADSTELVPMLRDSGDSVLEPGRYAISVQDAPSAPLLPVLTVPDGYAALDGGVGVGVAADDSDFGGYLWAWAAYSVATHPCDITGGPEPVGGRLERVGPSVADFADALAAQPMRTGADPVPVTVGGYDGLYVELAVPDDVNVELCPNKTFNLWAGRWQQVAGQVDMVWIVEVEGQRIILDVSYGPTATPEHVQQLRDMATTATFITAEGT